MIIFSQEFEDGFWLFLQETYSVRSRSHLVSTQSLQHASSTRHHWAVPLPTRNLCFLVISLLEKQTLFYLFKFSECICIAFFQRLQKLIYLYFLQTVSCRFLSNCRNKCCFSYTIHFLRWLYYWNFKICSIQIRFKIHAPYKFVFWLMRLQLKKQQQLQVHLFCVY